jgi:large subunit ribosomal protein L17
MRHKRVAKKFGRSKAHREQLMGGLVAHLIVQGRIETTLPKARQTRREAEKIVTLARKGTLASRRLAAARLRSPAAVKCLFDDVVPAMDGRAGGYTRIIKTRTRRGDASEMALIEWVAGRKVAATQPDAEPAATKA